MMILFRYWKVLLVLTLLSFGGGLACGDGASGGDDDADDADDTDDTDDTDLDTNNFPQAEFEN